MEEFFKDLAKIRATLELSKIKQEYDINTLHEYTFKMYRYQLEIIRDALEMTIELPGHGSLYLAINKILSEE